MNTFLWIWPYFGFSRHRLRISQAFFWFASLTLLWIWLHQYVYWFRRKSLWNWLYNNRDLIHFFMQIALYLFRLIDLWHQIQWLSRQIESNFWLLYTFGPELSDALHRTADILPSRELGSQRPLLFLLPWTGQHKIFLKWDDFSEFQFSHLIFARNLSRRQGFHRQETAHWYGRLEHFSR